MITFLLLQPLGLSKGAHPNGRKNESLGIFRTLFESFFQFFPFCRAFFQAVSKRLGPKKVRIHHGFWQMTKIEPEVGDDQVVSARHSWQ